MHSIALNPIREGEPPAYPWAYIIRDKKKNWYYMAEAVHTITLHRYTITVKYYSLNYKTEHSFLRAYPALEYDNLSLWYPIHYLSERTPWIPMSIVIVEVYDCWTATTVPLKVNPVWSQKEAEGEIIRILNGFGCWDVGGGAEKQWDAYLWYDICTLLWYLIFLFPFFYIEYISGSWKFPV